MEDFPTDSNSLRIDTETEEKYARTFYIENNDL